MNKSVNPSYCKISQVSPVIKEGNKADVCCYRPICLLCCISKVFEKNLFDQLYEHSRHKLHENQFGFRRQRSAVVQLLLFLDSVYKKIDDKNIKKFSVLYVDFAKHLTKLRIICLSINLKYLELAENYLKSKFHISINANNSLKLKTPRLI